MNTKLCPMRPYDSSKTEKIGSAIAPMVSSTIITEFSECIKIDVLGMTQGLRCAGTILSEEFRFNQREIKACIISK